MSARTASGSAPQTTAPRILIVEDEPAVRFSLRVACEREGWHAIEAATGREALDAIDTQRPDLVLLDIMLPGMSGFDVCRQIRARDSSLPIIIVSARDDEVDKVVGLELGADDYVTKPFSVRELVARIRTALRRAAAGAADLAAPGAGASMEPDRLRYGALEIVPAERQVLINGNPVPLTRTEFNLLLVLAQAGGRVLTRDELVSQVWGYESEGSTRLLDSHIQHVRAKIEPEAHRPRYVLTVRDVGYRLNRRPGTS